MSSRKGFLIATVLALMTISSFAVISVQAATVPYPGSIYIKDVRVGGNLANPLDYNNGGVNFLLTSTGDSLGRQFSGAMTLAYYVIKSWQTQTGRSWPYYWRSQESVALEIQFHCIWPWIDTTTRRTTISFNDWIWD